MNKHNYSSTISRAFTKKRTVWLVLGVVAWIVAAILQANPNIAEQLYGKGIYPAVRWIFAHSTNLLPFPAIWLVIMALLYLGYRTIIRPVRKRNWSIFSLLVGIFSTAGAMIFLFYLLWGFNYSRPSIAERLQLSAPPLPREQLKAEFDRATEQLVRFTLQHQDVLPGLRDKLKPGTREDVNNAVISTLETVNFPVTGTVKGRLLGPEGILLVFNTAGIYIPFSGEGHVDQGMMPVQIPFTLAHELAHGHGVTDEGECNFLAYLACQQSADPYVQFSGLLSYWRYVASDYRRGFKEQYKNDYEALPELIKTFLVDIRENNSRFVEIMPKLRNRCMIHT